MDLTDNEKCLLSILTEASKELTTSELLKAMDKFPKLCKGCKSGTYLIRTGIALEKKGLISRKAGKGGFYWKLIKKMTGSP